MKMFTRIVVPTDFSESAGLALTTAAALARQFDASLHLVHVLEDPLAPGMWASEVYTAQIPGLRVSLVQGAERELRKCLTTFSVADVKATTEVRVGSPASTIVDFAVEQHADLIVMGTHGRGGIAHLLMGSVAERVIRTALCPVLITKGTKTVTKTASQSTIRVEEPAWT